MKTKAISILAVVLGFVFNAAGQTELDNLRSEQENLRQHQWQADFATQVQQQAAQQQAWQSQQQHQAIQRQESRRASQLDEQQTAIEQQAHQVEQQRRTMEQQASQLRQLTQIEDTRRQDELNARLVEQAGQEQLLEAQRQVAKAEADAAARARTEYSREHPSEGFQAQLEAQQRFEAQQREAQQQQVLQQQAPQQPGGTRDLNKPANETSPAQAPGAIPLTQQQDRQIQSLPEPKPD